MSLRSTFKFPGVSPFLLLATSVLACGASAVRADTATLVPTSYTTLAGTSGGQPVASSIAILDLSGSTDSWNKYVEFGPSGSQKYDGYQSFTLPASVTPASVTGIQVKVNYRGPSAATQTWTWKIYDWTTNAYVAVGTNATAPSWGNWTVLNFTVGGTFANYVRSSDGRIQIGLSANNTADAADIDYEAVIVTSSGGANTSSTSSAVSSKASSISSVVSSSKSSVLSSSKSNSLSSISSSSKSSVVSSIRSSSVSSVISSSRSSISSSKSSSLSSVISSSKSSVASSVASSSSSSTAQVGANYYVSPTGNNSNSGSLSSPWKTIQHAADTAAAGDTVYVRGGTYSEIVNFARSGSSGAGQRIIFRNYPNEVPTLDLSGKSVSGQIGVFTLENVSYVTIEGFDIKNFTTNNINNVPIGIYVVGAGSYVEILKNQISYIKNTANSDDANALGLLVAGTEAPASINNITISGNELHHLTLGSSESLSINGNVEYWKVINNIVHDNNNIGIDAIGFEETNSNQTYNQARDGLISGNFVYNITSYGNPAYGNNYAADGIYVDGGKRIIIENNTVHHTDFGIELASEHKGRSTSYVTVRNNLVWNNNTSGITIGGYDKDRGTTDYCTIVNNTFLFNDTKDTGSGEFQIQYYANNNVVKNNIFYARSSLLINNYTNSSSNPADIDYNIYFTSAGSGNAEFIWNGKSYTGFSNYWSATGKDPRSQFADPKFGSTSTPDLKVAAGSPAVNTGVTLQSSDVGVVDFDQKPRVQGSAIDIGAYELQ